MKESLGGGASIGKRIHMISNDECWTINIMIERIDFKYSYKKGTTEYSRIENVCETAVQEKIHEMLSDFQVYIEQ